MGKKIIDRCRICGRKFVDDIRYEVVLPSLDYCNFKVSADIVDGRSYLMVTVLDAKYRYSKELICESCVICASIEEVYSFGKKIKTCPRRNFEQPEGDDWFPGRITISKFNKVKFYDTIEEDE